MIFRRSDAIFSEDKKKSGDVKENKFIDVYQNKCKIPLDHKILKDY